MDGDAATELMREVRPGEDSASTRVPVVWAAFTDWRSSFPVACETRKARGTSLH